jgi:DNA-binding winged helix-turn-helix (wHTH) protein/tetratricopeptide (TPR) repeat protein
LPHKPFYEFGPFSLDVALNRLERAGVSIALPPKAFDLLVLLAQNADRLMPKGELMERLWHDTFVEEANLTQHVYTLRKALGDHSDGRPYIETVPRRGYRLAADVRESAVAAPGEAGAPASPGPVVRDDERKYATVMYCAVADAAVIVERHGSATMHDVMDRVLAIAEDDISRYAGIISRRHADGFVAVFGAAVVHEDDGRRAILAGLALERRISRLDLPGGSDEPPLALRIGIDAGPLVISRVADAQHTEYSAVGETMRAADVLHQFARPGTILISEPVWRTADRHVAAEEVLPAPAGLRAFRVVGPLRAGAGVRQPRRALVPFRGRVQETALLAQLGQQALAGKGQVASIVGEAGMGKSRLVYEFTRAIGEQPDVVTLEGRCVSYGSLVPYLPLVDVLRAHVGADVTDAPEVIREAVDAAVRENGLPADAGGWLLRLLGHSDDRTAPEAASPQAIKARTFDVLRLLFLKSAVRRPLVIVVEDLHWIDRTSEEFLATLVERMVGARVILVATHRPGYRAPWLDRSYVTQMTLAPLTPSDSAGLVQSIAQEEPLDREVCRAILDRGEGNPFFLEELARTVAERGVSEGRIPETIQGVIMARLDRLPEVARRLLQTASVLGREVPLRELERLAQGGDLDVPLGDLCRQEFLYEKAGGDEPVFAFKHALTQDVAYDSLLSRRRRELHVEAARMLEELYRDRLEELTATLAYHYTRTDLIDESVTWLVRAAERAARLYANAEAILHLDLAARRLQRLPEGAERDRRMLDVALRNAHSLYFLGRFRESVEVLQPHEARVTRLDDAAVTGAYAFWLAHMFSRLGDQARAEASARRAIAAATSAGDQRTAGKAHGLLALEGHWGGRPRDGIAHGRKAVELLQPYPDQQWWLGMAHSYLAMNHLLLGDFEDALSEASQADRIGQTMGDPRLRTYAGFITAWVEASRGNAEAAIIEGRRSLERAPDRVSRAYAALFLAFAQLEQGAHDEAAEALGKVIPEFEGFGTPQFQTLATALRAEALRRQGQLEDASTLIADGLVLGTSANYQYGLGFAQRTAGRIARDVGRTDEAAARFAEAAATFERIGATFEASRCL